MAINRVSIPLVFCVFSLLVFVACGESVESNEQQEDENIEAPGSDSQTDPETDPETDPNPIPN